MNYEELESSSVLTKDDNGYPLFLLQVLDVHDHAINFNVWAVDSWEVDDAHTPCDLDKHLEGSIKWDGCSHLTFGDEGYLHFCGERYFKQHCEMLKALYKTATALIPRYCAEVAED